MVSRKVMAAAGAAAAVVGATVWGLAVSIGAGDAILSRVELPGERGDGRVGEAEVVASATVGAGPGQVGIAGGGEMRGPDSAGVDDRGRVYVLDGVNARVLRFSADGRFDRDFPLPDAGFEDLEVSRDRFAVLSRLDDRRVLLFDESEGCVATLAIAPEVPDVFRFCIVDGEVWVQAPSRDVVAFHAIGSLDGRSYEPTEQMGRRIEGKPTPVGTILRARRADHNNAAIDVLGEDNRVLERLRLRSSREVAAIVDVMGDRDGHVWGVWALHRKRSSDPDDVEGRLVVTEHGLDGEVLGTVETDDLNTPEPFRQFALSEAGELYQLVPSPEGMRVLHWGLVR